MSARSAVVVGAGFAGLSAALHLARKGVRVDVYEASDRPGGRAQSWSAGGYQFDLGPTLFVMTDVLRKTIGDAAFEALAFERLEPGYSVRWPDGTKLSVHSDIALMLETFARFEPGKGSALLRFLADVHPASVEARERMLEREHTIASFVAMMMRPGPVRPWIVGNLKKFVEKYVSHPRVVEAFTFQPLYLGTSPLQAPAMYALLPAEEIVGGVWYARGGTKAVVDALLAECETSGVRFHYNAPVDAIRRASDGRISVSAGSARIDADASIVAMDREPALALFGETFRARRPRYGHSALVWYFGIKRRIELDHHSVLLPDDPWRAYAALDRGEASADTMLYVHNPAVTDPSVAPEGGSAMLVLLPVPNRAAWKNEDVASLRERVLDRLEREAGPIRPFIEIERVRGPREFEAELGLMHGAAFGPDHRLDQMGPFRPTIAHPRMANVAFAGSGTHPGSGVPMVLISGRLAAERILAQR